jgi:WhiB family redox-sensing transcriptional regulator
MDPDLFYPHRGEPIAVAVKACHTCDVRDACLEYALDNRETFGIWGGLSERQRRKIRTLLRASARGRDAGAMIPEELLTDPAPNGTKPTHACKGCGAAIEGRPRAVWCTDQCRKQHTYGGADAEKPARRPGRPRKAGDKVSPLSPVPREPSPRPGLLEQVLVLADLVPQGGRLSIELPDGTSITACRL